MDGLVEKVREAIGDECPEANCDDPDCGQCNATARAAIEAVFDALRMPPVSAVEQASASGDVDDRYGFYQAMLATLRKQALG